MMLFWHSQLHLRHLESWEQLDGCTIKYVQNDFDRKDYPVEVVELKGFILSHVFFIHAALKKSSLDTVIDFSWEPRGERFAIVSSSDPNLGNPGPGITIKTDISFYQLDRSKNDFRLLSKLNCFVYYSDSIDLTRNAVFTNKQCN